MKIKVAAMQFAPAQGDTRKNLSTVENMVSEAALKGASLVVTPEICDTGYDLKDLENTARSIPNETTDLFCALAKKHRLTIVAGLAEKENGKFFNSAVIFDREGRIVDKYHKTHLCPIPPFDEPKVFAYGERLFVAEVSGVKLAPAICYDCRFPELYRRLALCGAQIIVQPTAFPLSRIDQLEICLRARAIENQFFLVTANFWGKVGGNELGGNSMIIGPEGKVLAKAGEAGDAVVTAELDLKDIETSRIRRPVFTKRRPELY